MALLRHTKPSHLNLVLKIAEVGQLQIAATAVGMSQPAASRVLAELEKNAGAALFKRSAKGMETTALGDAFVRQAHVILAALEGLDSDVARLKTGEAGVVRIGSVTGPAVSTLMPALEAVRARTPDIDVTIEVGPSTELVRGLDEGRFDFVFARVPPSFHSRDLLIHPARTEIVQLLIRDTHPMAGQKNVPASALTDFDWVIQERGSPIRQAVEDAFRMANVPVPTKVTNTSSLLIVLSLLRNSNVISPQANEVANLLSGQELGARLTTIDLTETMKVTPYFIIQHRLKKMPQAAQNFYEEVLQQI